MPLTFAHPAAVLPFSRNSKYVNFLAMVLGSMAPDFEYFLRGMPAGATGHTLSGFITFNLPIVVIVYFIYLTCIHQTLFSHLPSMIKVTNSQKTGSSSLLKGFVFLYSALFLPVLTYTVHIFDVNIPIFKILQHGSTIVGITVIISFMYFRARQNRGNSEELTTTKQKWMYWSLIALVTILLFCLWYFIDSVYDDHFMFENWSGSKMFKQPYAVDGDNVTLSGDRVEMFKMILSESEKLAIEKLREDYAALETQYNTLKEANEQYESAKLHSQREAILVAEEYSVLSEDAEFKALVEDMDKFSPEELSTKADLIFAKFAKSQCDFVAKETNKPKVISFNFNSKKETQKKPYGNLFSNK